MEIYNRFTPCFSLRARIHFGDDFIRRRETGLKNFSCFNIQLYSAIVKSSPATDWRGRDNEMCKMYMICYYISLFWYWDAGKEMIGLDKDWDQKLITRLLTAG